MDSVSTPQPEALRILYVIPSVSLKRGGPSVMVRTVTRALAKAGADITLVTTNDDGEAGILDVPLGTPRVEDGVTYVYLKRDLVFYTVSLGLDRWLRDNASRFDIIHTHALFGFPTFVAARRARRAGVPYVVKPMGTLNPWGVTGSHPFLKKISLRIVDRPLLARAAAIHFVTKHEQREAGAAWGGRGKGVVIPTPVNPHSEGDAGRFLRSHPELEGRDVVMFLSRIHESKGLDLLLTAIAEVSRGSPSVHLLVAGSGTPELESSLRDLVSKLGIVENVTWLGFIDRDDRWDALAASKVFALTSHTESFGLAVVEAMGAGAPVLVSDQVAVHEEITDARAGRVTSLDPSDIASTLSEMLQDPHLADMGERGAALVQKRFTSEAVAESLLDLYGQILDEQISDGDPERSDRLGEDLIE